MIKDKKSLKASTPSRRKFFKAAAVTGAAAATAVAMIEELKFFKT